MAGKIRCADCGYCKEFRPVGSSRSRFFCGHFDREHIRNYYKEHQMRKMEGFIGFAAKYAEEVPIKTSPAWCPRKAGGRK